MATHVGIRNVDLQNANNDQKKYDSSFPTHTYKATSSLTILNDSPCEYMKDICCEPIVESIVE